MLCFDGFSHFIQHIMRMTKAGVQHPTSTPIMMPAISPLERLFAAVSEGGKSRNRGKMYSKVMVSILKSHDGINKMLFGFGFKTTL